MKAFLKNKLAYTGMIGGLVALLITIIVGIYKECKKLFMALNGVLAITRQLYLNHRFCKHQS